MAPRTAVYQPLPCLHPRGRCVRSWAARAPFGSPPPPPPQLTVVTSGAPTRTVAGEGLYVIPAPRPVSHPRTLPPGSVSGGGAGGSTGPAGPGGAGDDRQQGQSPASGGVGAGAGPESQPRQQLLQDQRLADCGSASSTGAATGLGEEAPGTIEPAFLSDNEDDFSLFDLMSPVAQPSGF